MKHELHANDEGMVHLVQNVFFQVQVLYRIMLNNNIFSNTLHGIKLFCVPVLNQVDLNKNSDEEIRLKYTLPKVPLPIIFIIWKSSKPNSTPEIVYLR